MLNHLSYRLLIFPVLMLAGFIGVFGYIEYRKLSNDQHIQAIINDPVNTTAFRLEHAAWRLETVFESYKTALAEKREKSLDDFIAAFEELNKQETLITALLLREHIKAEDYLTELDKLSLIRANTGKIKEILANETFFSPALLGLLTNRMEAILDTAHDLGLDINTKHRSDINRLLYEITQDEKQRALLAIFIIICGFALIIVLLDVVYHFKHNAERAFAAEKTNAVFAAALQSTRVGVLISDMRKDPQQAIFVNEAFTRMTGYKLEEVESGRMDFLFGWNTDAAAITRYQRALSLSETTTIDFMLYRKDGTPFWGEMHLSPVLDNEGNLTYYVSLFNDITVFRQTQQDLMDAKSMAEQASAVKTNFLAMMSHEIRTPINGILGVLKLLQETKVDGEQKHLLDIAHTSSAVLHNIINDILDYAKMEAGKVDIIAEPFSLRELVKDITDLSTALVGEKQIKVETTVQSDIPDMLVGDAGRLRQIMLNLFSNAIKFTDTGFVRLGVLSLMNHEIDGQPGHLMRFEITDSGIGIAPEDQNKLFQEFSQIERSFHRRFGGTGLGLAICKRLVTMMGGEIGVESQQGKGSKFWFMVPLRLARGSDMKKAKGFEPSLPTKAMPANKSTRILLVEDNETNRLVACRYLEKAGVSVDEACNGNEAIDMVKKKRYDMILMDISMPVMDGMLATCHIRAMGGGHVHIPIIALTAHVMAGDKELCLAAGMNDYLNKPLEYPSLLRILSRWLHLTFDDPIAPIAEESQKGKNRRGHEQAPLLNEDVLLHMKEALGASAVEQVTRTFLKDSAEKINLFKSADMNQVYDAAHTLKSCSGNCGLIRFSCLMERLETATKTHDYAQAKKLLPLVEPIYRESRKLLEKERDRYIGS